ncbi:MAG: hypothetical protein JWM77_3378 [Rhodospirillales bacterium]|nr:hypothetical protein [Rhodospirillales bacterium]
MLAAMNRTALIALPMVVIVVGIFVWMAQEPPMDASQSRAYEARCMTAYTDWMAKKTTSPHELVECEKHFADKGDKIQASFFASARRGPRP